MRTKKQIKKCIDRIDANSGKLLDMIDNEKDPEKIEELTASAMLTALTNSTNISMLAKKL